MTKMYTHFSSKQLIKAFPVAVGALFFIMFSLLTVPAEVRADEKVEKAAEGHEVKEHEPKGHHAEVEEIIEELAEEIDEEIDEEVPEEISEEIAEEVSEEIIENMIEEQHHDD